MKNPLGTFTSRYITVLFLAFAPLVLAGTPAAESDHLSFATPEAAVDAFITALEQDDTTALAALLGPGSADVLSSGDAVQDGSNRAAFLARYKRKHSLSGDGDQRTLVVGNQEWPFPIPVVESDGRWYLNGEEGAEELVYRRIGANELGAIAVCNGLVGAQRDYAAQGHDGDAAGIYALKLISDAGMQNGLYWPTAEGEAPSPAGQFIARAAEEGYRRGTRVPYHGYFYRLLYEQGSAAEGGALDYFSDGLMTKGFAIIAWPAEYEVSGVMTFIVNQDGVVFQKDLGDETTSAANGIDTFDPDSSWAAVTDES
jgi:hypothetical protein